jgi:hypothetical protein
MGLGLQFQKLTGLVEWVAAILFFAIQNRTYLSGF